MARTIPVNRLDDLVRCATEVFIREGYRRTQMADVADALGVAKGTLYLYVESKEALFDLVVRCAAGDSVFPTEQPLPLRTPKRNATMRFVRDRLAQGQQFPVLAAALGAKRVADARAELTAVLGELYDSLDRNRTAIQLVDSCARDYPELAAVWFEGGRNALLAPLASHLERRMDQGVLPRADPRLAARLVIETVVMWAVHRHWDPAPQAMEESAVRDTVVRFIVGGLADEAPATHAKPTARHKRRNA